MLFLSKLFEVKTFSLGITVINHQLSTCKFDPFLGLFKNGDPWFGPVNFHYLPGREVTSLESLFNEINPKIDLLNGVSYMFDIDGKRITSLDQIQDGGIYICSASKKFLPGNYGAYGDGFHVEPEPIPNSRNNGLISPTPIKSGLFKKQHR